MRISYNVYDPNNRQGKFNFDYRGSQTQMPGGIAKWSCRKYLQTCWFHWLGVKPEAKVSPFKTPHPHLWDAWKQCLCHLYQRRSLFMQAQQRWGRWSYIAKCQVLAKTKRHYARSWRHMHTGMACTSNVSEWSWGTTNFKLLYPQSLW